jgi:hypothetical protein
LGGCLAAQASDFLANFNSRFSIDFILADCPETAMGHGRLWIREYPSFSLLADLLQAPALNAPFIFSSAGWPRHR